MSSLLIVEDEQHLADGLAFNLKAEGHTVEVAGEGERALARIIDDKQSYDALVLDVMLPGIDGFEVAARLRKYGVYVPILMLTARGRPEDVLKGFEAGADDYLAKPFELAILIARLRGLLRRTQWSQAQRAGDTNGDSKSKARGTFIFSGNTIDFDALELRVGKQTHHLTAMEADLLAYLVGKAGQAVSRKAILEDVWGLHEDTDTRAIDNFIVRLRKYIEKKPTLPKHLVTVRGVGYKFVAEPGKGSG
ncbi:MAG: response regulator transcription factor [Acidobacteriales bacterium]|nr:response regulator transcription factor [Terriglobales bacterium]